MYRTPDERFDDLPGFDFTPHYRDWEGMRLAHVDEGGATTGIADRVSRLVIMDSGLFTGYQKMGNAWQMFRDFIDSNPDLPIGTLVNAACVTDLPPEIVAAYEAPFPTSDSKAGPRTLPALIPQTPDAPGAAEGRAAVEALATDDRPILLLWAESDMVLPLDSTGRAMEKAFPVSEPLHVIEGRTLPSRRPGGRHRRDDRGLVDARQLSVSRSEASRGARCRGVLRRVSSPVARRGPRPGSLPAGPPGRTRDC